jgi:hypothetical protein
MFALQNRAIMIIMPIPHNSNPTLDACASPIHTTLARWATTE